MLRRLLLTAGSAALYALPFPPWDVTITAWGCLVPLFVGLRGATVGGAALLGLVWGTLAIWAVGWWVPAAIAIYWGQSLFFGVAFSVAASLVFAGSYAAGFGASFAWTVSRVRPLLRAPLVASLWVAWEFARAQLLTGDPWLVSGYALATSPALAQLSDLGGVYALSFLVGIANATLAEIAIEWPRGSRAWARTVSPAVAILAAAVLYGRARLAEELPEAPVRRVLVVQGNNSLGSQWRPEFYGIGLERYLELSQQAAQLERTDLVVWPESAVTFFLADEPVYRHAIAQQLGASGAPLLVGGPHYEGSPADPSYFNSAFLIAPSGEIQARYDKRQLLPFAEYFPLRTIQFLRRRFERVRTFTSGRGDGLFTTSIGRLGVTICLEGIFPELAREQARRGAEILVNLSNDAWLGVVGPGAAQHLRMVQLRAIENRRWVVRATTTGISALVDPRGQVVLSAARNEAATLRGQVVPLHERTPYQRVGDLFAYANVAVVLLASVWTTVEGASSARKVS